MGRRGLFLAASLFLAGTPVWAQTIDRVDIVEYGVYTADRLKSQRDENGQLHSIIRDVHLENATATVSAELGVKFGMRFRVVGEPDGKPVTIKKTIIYPPPGLRPPSAPEPLLRSEGATTAKIGETGYIGFEFDDSWELVPGAWTIQLWQGDRMLAEQRFNILVGRSL